MACGRKLSAANITTDLNSDQTLLRLARWALALTAAAIPLYVVRWHIGPIPTTLLENLVLVTAAIYALGLVLGHAPRPGRTPFEVPIALFLIAGVIGIFVAPDHRGALGIFRAYLVEPVAIYYVAVAVLSTTRSIELLLAAWAVGAVLFGLDEIVTFLRALAGATLIPGHAAAAFDIDPNQVAQYIEPLLGVAAGFALFGRGTQRAVAIGTLAVLFPAELATLSRGGLLSLAALAAVAILTITDLRLRLGVAAATVVAAIAAPFLPVLGPRISHAFDATGTMADRLGLWRVSLKMLRDHPVFGAGINGYQTVVAPYRATDPNQAPALYPHNVVLTSWTELGLLGLFAFMYILVSLIVQPWRAFARVSGMQRPLLWGLGTAMVMIAVHGLVDSPYWKNDLSLEFWILASLEIASLRAMRAGAAAS